MKEFFAEHPGLFGLFLAAAGIFAICGAALNWGFFINHYKARLFVAILGRNGARVFYGILGVFMIGFAVLFTFATKDKKSNVQAAPRETTRSDAEMPKLPKWMEENIKRHEEEFEEQVKQIKAESSKRRAEFAERQEETEKQFTKRRKERRKEFAEQFGRIANQFGKSGMPGDERQGDEPQDDESQDDEPRNDETEEDNDPIDDMFKTHREMMKRHIPTRASDNNH